MTFIRTFDDEFVRLSEVRRVREQSTHVAQLVMADGEVKECSNSAWTAARISAGRRFFPALPGTFLLHYGRSEGRVWVAREPILAWAVAECGVVDPVATSGIYRSETCSPACLHADGTVHDALGLYETYEAWLADVQADEVPRSTGSP